MPLDRCSSCAEKCAHPETNYRQNATKCFGRLWVNRHQAHKDRDGNRQAGNDAVGDTNDAEMITIHGLLAHFF